MGMPCKRYNIDKWAEDMEGKIRNNGKFDGVDDIYGLLNEGVGGSLIDD